MKRIILLISFIAIGGAGGLLAYLYGSGELNSRFFLGRLDPVLRDLADTRGSRISTFLEENTGQCRILSGKWSEKMDKSWRPLVNGGLPTGKQVLLEDVSVHSGGTSGNGAIVCKDGRGSEFVIRSVSSNLALAVGRAWRGPMKITILSSAVINVSGRNLALQIHSPIGPLLLTADGAGSVTVSMQANDEARLFFGHIVAKAGSIKVSPIEREGPGVASGIVDLSSEKGAELRWAGQPDPIVNLRPGVVLPSGFYWSPLGTPADQRVNH